jgi:hypothetical protein
LDPETEAPYSIYKNKPLLFFRDVLNWTPWTKQEEITNDLLKVKRVAVASCNGSGKTALAARIVAWFLSTRKDSIIVTTSATGAQLYGPFWRNIRQVVATSKKKLPGTCMTKAWQVAPQWYATGIASDDETQFQGFHAEGEHGELLVVIDEASGCENYVFDAIRGYLTRPNSYLLLLGNPNRSTGGFAELFKRKSENWSLHSISAFDVPENIMDRAWIEEMRETLSHAHGGLMLKYGI